MSRSPRRHSLSRLVLTGLAALSLGAAAGCGGSDSGSASTAAISADTFCSDFMTHPPAERAAATAQIATAMGMQEPTSAEWVSTLEGRCAAAPDLKVGDFFHHFQ